MEYFRRNGPYRNFGSDALRSFAHDVETDMSLAALFENILIDADTVVDDRKFELSAVLNVNEYLRGFGVLAHVGKRFLHDENHLNLLSVGEFRLRPRNRELDRQFCLRFESPC